MGFQIYDKVLIRILLNQPLLEGSARVFLMLMEGWTLCEDVKKQQKLN